MLKRTPHARDGASGVAPGAERGDTRVHVARPRYRVNNVPEELKARPHWVVFEVRPTGTGKLNKMPYVPGTTKEAKCNDPSTWRSFEEALADAERSGRN